MTLVPSLRVCNNLLWSGKEMRTQQEPLSATCACTAIHRASRAVTQLYDLALSPTGMRATQLMMLQIIADNVEIAQCEFARKYSISVETLSRRFSRLLRKGLVSIRTGKHLERIYSLTEQGQTTLHKARPCWENAQHRLRMELGEADWQSILEICDRAVRAAHRAEQLRAPNGQQLHTYHLSPQVERGKGRAA
jgi:DNA-binding MarR family transcriptional regulator